MIPTRYKNVNFATSDIKELPDNFLLTGPVGCGKTHYSWCKYKDLLTKDRTLRPGRDRDYDSENGYTGKNIIFTTMPDLLAEIRRSFDGQGPHENEIIETYSTCDYLIIDDLGAEKITEFARGVLFQIINHRYNYCKATMITSNLSLGEIAERFDDRIASRIASMCKIIKLDDKDYRMGGNNAEV